MLKPIYNDELYHNCTNIVKNDKSIDSIKDNKKPPSKKKESDKTDNDTEAKGINPKHKTKGKDSVHKILSKQ